MTTFLVTLEIIVEEEEDVLMSEVETAMHKMIRAVKTGINVSDYGLDVDYLE